MIWKWRDQVIEDIEQWAHDRHEKMVDVTFKKRSVNPYAGKNAISYYLEKESYPESFWNTLRITPDMGIHVKIKRRKPKTK